MSQCFWTILMNPQNRLTCTSAIFLSVHWLKCTRFSITQLIRYCQHFSDTTAFNQLHKWEGNWVWFLVMPSVINISTGHFPNTEHLQISCFECFSSNINYDLKINSVNKYLYVSKFFVTIIICILCMLFRFYFLIASSLSGFIAVCGKNKFQYSFWNIFVCLREMYLWLSAKWYDRLIVQ